MSAAKVENKSIAYELLPNIKLFFAFQIIYVSDIVQRSLPHTSQCSKHSRRSDPDFLFSLSIKNNPKTMQNTVYRHSSVHNGDEKQFEFSRLL